MFVYFRYSRDIISPGSIFASISYFGDSHRLQNCCDTGLGFVCLIFNLINLFFSCAGLLLLPGALLSLWRAMATLWLCYPSVTFRWLLLLWSTGSRACRLSYCGSQALEHRLSINDAQAMLLCSMWDLPGSGIEPMSPALAGRFFTSELPGRPQA